MISSRERSKLWVLQENPRVSEEEIDRFWDYWCLDNVASGLDYFLLHCCAAFGPVVTLDWVAICDPEKRTIAEIPLEDAIVLIDKLEVMWRRRLRSSPGWELHRIMWVNKANRVKKRALNLVKERKNAEASEWASDPTILDDCTSRGSHKWYEQNLESLHSSSAKR